MAVACFTYGWGRWCACLSLGACPVGAWGPWRWRILRAGSVGLLLRRRFLCTAPGPVAVSVFCVCLGSLWGVFCVLLWAVPGTAGPIIVWVSGSVAWGVFCVRPGAQWRGLFWVQLGAVAGVFCVLSGLRACCGARVLWVSGLLGGASFARRSGPISGCGWGLAAWRVFRVRLGAPTAGRVIGFGFILFVMRWIVPLCLILIAFFPPFSARVPKPCAETSYLKVQCLCLATLGYAILCAGRRGYNTWCVWVGNPPENGVGSQRRYCYCRVREVGNTSENGMGSLGKFAFIPPFPLKIQCRRGARQNFPLKI